jgi:hypothetical protein
MSTAASLRGLDLRRAFASFLLALLALYGVVPFAKAALTRPVSVAVRTPLPALQVPAIPLPLLHVPRVAALPALPPLRVAPAAPRVQVVSHRVVSHRRVHVPVVTDVVPAVRAPRRAHAKPHGPQPVVVTDTIGNVPELPSAPAAAAPDPTPAADPAPQPRLS